MAIDSFIKSVKRTHGLSFMVKWLRQLTIDDQLAHDLNWEQYHEDLQSPRIGYHKGRYHNEPYKINPGTGSVFCGSLNIETYIYNLSKNATLFILIGIANYPLLK
jgi:hypothetical protein